jgi:hypothetical protein
MFKYNFDKANYTGLSLALKSVNWSMFFNRCRNIDDFWTTWLGFIMSLIELYVPVCHVRVGCNRPRLPNCVRNLITRRNTAWRSFRSGSPSAHGVYKRLRGRCRKALLLHFKTMESKVLKLGNSKRFFSFINKRLNPKSTACRLQNSDGSFTTDSEGVANAFSAEFCHNYSHASEPRLPSFHSALRSPAMTHF